MTIVSEIKIWIIARDFCPARQQRRVGRAEGGTLREGNEDVIDEKRPPVRTRKFRRARHAGFAFAEKGSLCCRISFACDAGSVRRRQVANTRARRRSHSSTKAVRPSAAIAMGIRDVEAGCARAELPSRSSASVVIPLIMNPRVRLSESFPTTMAHSRRHEQNDNQSRQQPSRANDEIGWQRQINCADRRETRALPASVVLVCRCAPPAWAFVVYS